MEKIANLPDMIKEWVERYSKLGAKKRMECLLFAHSIKYSEIMQKLLRSGMVSEEKLDERLSQFPSYKESTFLLFLQRDSFSLLCNHMAWFVYIAIFSNFVRFANFFIVFDF